MQKGRSSTRDDKIKHSIQTNSYFYYYNYIISDNESKDASYINLITVAHPEVTSKPGYLLSEPETPGLTPTLPQ